MKFASILVVILLLLSVVSCSSTEKTFMSNESVISENNSSNSDGFHADWILFDSITEANHNADCLIIGEIVEAKDCLSVGYTVDDFLKYDDYLETDTWKASMVKLSIRTPYSVRVKEIISADVSISVGDIIELYQIGGSYCGVTLSNGDFINFDNDKQYVLLLNEYQNSNKKYYSMITPLQGYACIESQPQEINQLASDNAGLKVNFTSHEVNRLFDGIESIEDLYAAVGSEK